MKYIKSIFSEKGVLYFFRFALSFVLIFFLAFAPFFVLSDLSKLEAQINKVENFEYQGILEIWHIETFEGGSVARSKFLQNEANIFEKAHKGTTILIETMDLEQFKLNFNLGKKPDMLSFGVGIGSDFVDDLCSLDSLNTRQDLLDYGRFNGKQIAIPYILGGYAIISKTEKNKNIVGVGLSGTTNPMECLRQNNMQIENLFSQSIDIDSYDAYDKFIKDNFEILIGTQRDVFRCLNRMQKGLLNVEFKFLEKWTDLVQYISVFKNEEPKQSLCKKFAYQVLSQDAQSKLKNYNLFSTNSQVSLYQNDEFKDFENCLKGKLISEFAFSNFEEIENKKSETLKSVFKG